MRCILPVVLALGLSACAGSKALQSPPVSPSGIIEAPAGGWGRVPVAPPAAISIPLPAYPFPAPPAVPAPLSTVDATTATPAKPSLPAQLLKGAEQRISDEVLRQVKALTQEQEERALREMAKFAGKATGISPEDAELLRQVIEVYRAQQADPLAGDTARYGGGALLVLALGVLGWIARNMRILKKTLPR